MTTCETCGRDLGGQAPGWCEACGTGTRLGAQQLVGWLLADAVELDTPDGGLDADPLRWAGYARVREQARERTGADESVVAVTGRIVDSAVEVVAVVWDFAFMGGSMSSGAGAVIAAAYDTAHERRLPVVLLVSTGGARMQEGMASLVQMAATAVAAGRHADAGLLQIAVLRDPTTGGVFASMANLAHVLLAEPGATIGFAGPRVAEAMTGGPLPSGSHTARGARAAGLVDAVVPRPDLPWVLARLCAWPGSDAPPARDPTLRTHKDQVAPAVDDETARTGERTPPGDAWTQVQRARAPGRSRAPAFLDLLDVVGELHGDRAGVEDASVRVALARLPRPGAHATSGIHDASHTAASSGRSAVVIALDPTGAGRLGSGAYRKAWRGLRLAAQLTVPVVTLIDTPGADASAASEAGGIASHIARTFTEVLRTPVPVVALVVGEGGSGGALAFAVGDRLLIGEHAVFSVIAPEGAAAILHRDAGRAAEVARLLRPTAADLADLGIADEVVPEPAGVEVTTAWAAVARHLDDLDGKPPDTLVAARAERWRHAGQWR